MSMTSPSSMQFRGHTFDLEASGCDFCGGDDFIPFWQKMRYGLNLPTVFCKRCGLCQSRPRPTATALDLFYSKLYNQFHSRETPIDPKGEYVTRSARTAAPRVEVLKKFLDPTKPLRVMEIGTGVGQFQRIAREKTQWALEGIEPGEAQAAFCVSQGANVRNVFLADADLEEGAYDAVVSFHVFEHVKEPSDFIARASRLVKPGGLLYIEVPNLARPGSHFDEFLQFPHLYNFSSNTLRNYVSVIGGLRPIFTAERTQSLGLVARKLDDGSKSRVEKPHTGDYETYDVENFIQRLRMLERVFKLADGIPNVSLLGKVRGTLMSI